MSLFVLGATGTLGLQVAYMGRRRNYSVTCLIRRYTLDTDNLTFLGARIFYGDINNEAILLESMFASNVIVDAVTSRVYDAFERIDYDAKLLVLRIAKELGVDRFVFFSLANAEKFDTIPVVQAKLYLESIIRKSTVPYTIFRLAGFYQGLVNEYARPVFDKKQIYVTDNYMPISYIDCIDAARLVIRSFSSSKFENRVVTISGLQTWTPKKVLKACKKRSGLKPKIKYLPLRYILVVRYFAALFEDTWYLTRKLSLIDIIRRNTPDLVIDPTEMLELFEIKPRELRPFDYYLYYYYGRAFEVLFRKSGGFPEDDQKEVEKWLNRGAKLVEVEESETYD